MSLARNVTQGDFLFSWQVSMAYKNGAKGVILYSDPAEYAPYGFYSWSLTPDAVQRGSVYPGPTFGDPLTHGLPSTPGMSRSSRDDVSLPTIPVHVITYREAEQFLRRMKGSKRSNNFTTCSVFPRATNREYRVYKRN